MYVHILAGTCIGLCFSRAYGIKAVWIVTYTSNANRFWPASWDEDVFFRDGCEMRMGSEGD